MFCVQCGLLSWYQIAGVHKFSKNLKATPNSRRQKVYIKEVPYSETSVLEQPAKLTLTWRFLLGSYQPIHIFFRSREEFMHPY
jgi:hypothetical protein